MNWPNLSDLCTFVNLSDLVHASNRAHDKMCPMLFTSFADILMPFPHGFKILCFPIILNAFKVQLGTFGHFVRLVPVTLAVGHLSSPEIKGY